MRTALLRNVGSLPCDFVVYTSSDDFTAYPQVNVFTTTCGSFSESTPEPQHTTRLIILRLIDESRLCMYASDGSTIVRCSPGKRHLLECICSRHTCPISGFMVRGAIKYNSLSHLVFVQGKENRVRYIAQVINPVLLLFFSPGW